MKSASSELVTISTSHRGELIKGGKKARRKKSGGIKESLSGTLF